MAAEPKTTTGDCCARPLEICTEILSRLPAKSILRFKSVRKSWYSLVSCPTFITRSLNKNRNRILLRLYDDRAQRYSFSSHDDEHDDVPKAFLGSNVQILGSCNGLVCLSKYDWDRNDADSVSFSFLIWNPTIRKVVELPSRTFLSRAVCRLTSWSGSTRKRVDVPDIDFSYFGFGFDSITSDYKVLCMFTNSVDFNVSAVYDLRKGVWRDVSPPMHPWKVGRPTSECYLDGAVYWTGYRDGKNSDRILLSFDMSDEIFRETRMPSCAELTGNGDVDDRFVQTQSVTFDGLIHVIVWGRSTRDCSVWVMKEYGVTESWTKLFCLDLLSNQLLPATDPSTFRLWKNEEVLILHDYDVGGCLDYGSDEALVLYNIGSRTCKRLYSFIKSISDVSLREESSFNVR